jgi:hypothetical protein
MEGTINPMGGATTMNAGPRGSNQMPSAKRYETPA